MIPPKREAQAKAGSEGKRQKAEKKERKPPNKLLAPRAFK